MQDLGLYLQTGVIHETEVDLLYPGWLLNDTLERVARAGSSALL